MSNRIDFVRVNGAALSHIESIIQRWLPNGQRHGAEWVSKNPQRNDRKLGSFKVNLQSGNWGDFSIGKYGGDIVSLAAYLHCDGDQRQAAINVAEMLGVSPYE